MDTFPRGLVIFETISHARELWVQIKNLTRDDFPLPTFGPKLRELVDEYVHKRGFQMIRSGPSLLMPRPTSPLEANAELYI